MPLATSDISLELPRPALRVIEALESAGFEAWAVGGWVRDALLARTSHDVDVTTSASWQESKQVLLAAGMAVHERVRRMALLQLFAILCLLRLQPIVLRAVTAIIDIPMRCALSAMFVMTLGAAILRLMPWHIIPPVVCLTPMAGKQTLSEA